MIYWVKNILVVVLERGRKEHLAGHNECNGGSVVTEGEGRKRGGKGEGERGEEGVEVRVVRQASGKK